MLAERGDAESEALLLGYLDELPWGLDRRPTVTLLEILQERHSDAGEQALRRALDRHRTTGPVRAYLIEALAGWSLADAARAAVSELHTAARRARWICSRIGWRW